MPMYGYALALFSRIREASESSWPKHPRPDVRHAFKKSPRYLAKNGIPELRRVRWTSARPAIDPGETALCEDCRISIGENQAEVEFEWREPETASRRRQVLFKWTCLCMAVIATNLALLEWMRGPQ